MLKRQSIRVVMAELIWVPLYEGQGAYYDVLKYLGERGYRLYDLYNFRYGASGELLWGDAVFLPKSRASGVV